MSHRGAEGGGAGEERREAQSVNREATCYVVDLSPGSKIEPNDERRGSFILRLLPLPRNDR